MLAIWFRLVGPQRSIELFGVRLLGFNAENGNKLLFSIVLIVLVRLIARLVMAAGMAISKGKHDRLEFWTRQVVRVTSAILIVLGVASIWFDDPTRLAIALGLVTAGLAFALQKVVTAFAGYILILRGKTFMMRRADIQPRVFMRLTDNWIEFTVRFLCPDSGIRDIKDAISRDLLKGLDEAKIGIASTTFEIVGLPPMRIERNGADRAKAGV